MHKIHIIIVKGYREFEDAVYEVKNAIEEWGTENNWFTIEGGFDSEGNRFVHEKGSFFQTIQTLDELKEIAKNFFQLNFFAYKT